MRLNRRQIRSLILKEMRLLKEERVDKGGIYDIIAGTMSLTPKEGKEVNKVLTGAVATPQLLRVYVGKQHHCEALIPRKCKPIDGHSMKFVNDALDALEAHFGERINTGKINNVISFANVDYNSNWVYFCAENT